MKKVISVEEYIEANKYFAEALTVLRNIIKTTELNESIKWNAPIYDLNGKNVIGLGAFKQHFGLWFFNGVFLKDELKLLVNAQENKTKALRQMRFNSISEIDNKMVLNYINEAIENQKLGKEIKPTRNKTPIEIPDELSALLNTDKALHKSFKAISLSKQREYCSYISEAKRDATKQTRLKKITPLILQGAGLHDKYKNC